MVKYNFAVNVKTECIFQNITLKELSNRTGISYTTILSYTKDAGSLPRVDLAYKVAQALDVSIEFLLTGKEPLAKEKVHHLHVLEDMKKVHIKYLTPLAMLIHELAVVEDTQGAMKNGKLQVD